MGCGGVFGAVEVGELDADLVPVAAGGLLGEDGLPGCPVEGDGVAEFFGVDARTGGGGGEGLPGQDGEDGVFSALGGVRGVHQGWFLSAEGDGKHAAGACALEQLGRCGGQVMRRQASQPEAGGRS
ncbi:hypothetical protein ACU4GG_34465 [Streptomyces nojiriensis]